MGLSHPEWYVDGRSKRQYAEGHKERAFLLLWLLIEYAFEFLKPLPIAWGVRDAQSPGVA